MIVLLGTLACVVLILTSAFFSAAETALVALSSHKAKHIAVKNPALARDLASWIQRPHELLTVVLAGNTVVNVMFAALLSALLHYYLTSHTPYIFHFMIWLGATFVVLMIGEMAPKFLARANAEKMSTLVLPVLSVMVRVCAPIINAVSSMVGIFFPKLKTRELPSVLAFSLEELKGLLEDQTGAAGVPSESVGMMTRVLEIHGQRVSAIMTKLDKVDMINLDIVARRSPGRDLLIDLIIEKGHTRTPVKEHDKIIGYIHSDDLLPLMLRDTKRDLKTLVRHAPFVPHDRRVSELLNDFSNSGIYCAFVQNAKGLIEGFITLEDVLEEITGEILDEYDVEHK